jgi:hypothetical protein
MKAFLAAFVALLCSVTHAQTATTGPYWAGPALSGSWYDPARSGEGIIVQMQPTGRVLAVWFTYPTTAPTAPSAAAQAWLVADDGVAEGNTVRFNAVLQPQGGVFGAGFDPAKINRAPWGTLTLEVRDCNTLVARYAGPAAFGSGERTLQRLTVIDQVDCTGARSLTPSGARALDGLQAKSGTWFVPSRSGEGWLLEDLPGGRATVYWFTYDTAGNQAYATGVGTRSGGRYEFNELITTRGTLFGNAFNAANVQRVPWGSLTLTFSQCNQAQVRYASTVPGYGSAEYTAVRLADIAGAPCIDGTPAPRLRGSWAEAAAMPAPFQSELAATTFDGKLYALGGAGDDRGFKRYDPASNSWTRLPDMPSGRNHHVAFAVDGGVYFSGGAVDAAAASEGYRYDIAAQRWEARPEMIYTYGSQAAVLNGRAYIGDLNGELKEYDTARRVLRVISPHPAKRERDHSQVVAYLGEIWMISGRTPETRSVVIYDPVSERWRDGPSLARGRGGFAAAVVGDQIMIGGGELLANGRVVLEPTTEIYTAGGNTWAAGPNLPVPVHGVPGAALNGRFYVMSGSTKAGAFDGATGRVFSIELMP